MNKCVRTATIRYEIKPSAGNGPLERQFCPSTEFAGEPGNGELSLSWNNFIRYQFADCA